MEEFLKQIIFIFNLAIFLSLSIAVFSLVYSGFVYLTSAGKPEKTKEAKKRIFSTLFGLAIVLSSFLLLQTINPSLVKIGLPELKIFPFPLIPSAPPSVPPGYTNYLWRIVDITQNTRIIIGDENQGIIKSVQKIENYVLNCDCQLTHPVCACLPTEEEKKSSSSQTGPYYMQGGCNALYCYAQNSQEPCPDDNAIKIEGGNLVALTSEILYYKNRALAESQDFLDQIDKVLNPSIAFYEEKIKAELANLSQNPQDELQKQLLADLNKAKEKLLAKKDYFSQMAIKLTELSNIIGQLPEVIIGNEGITKLPEKCGEQVKEKCQGSCQGGCHNQRECLPVSCQGGNPCPIDKIQGAGAKIESFKDKIWQISQNIEQVANEIVNLDYQ